jgi:SP family general alpha glucoside:H+ symporter-like MFS transporter
MATPEGGSGKDPEVPTAAGAISTAPTPLAAPDAGDDDVAAAKRNHLLAIDATREITQAEHELAFRDAVRQYPGATFWAMFFCIAVIMAGFDAQIITSFYALPAFQQKYGDMVENGNYEISAPWQTALGMGNPIGQVVGALASGYPLEMFGRRWTLAICCVYSIIFVFVQFFATSIGMLCAGEILGGLAYGFYVVIAPTYASEICPLALRGFLETSVNLAFVIGQFVAQGCAAGVETRLDEWAYRIPFVSRALDVGAWQPQTPFFMRMSASV